MNTVADVMEEIHECDRISTWLIDYAIDVTKTSDEYDNMDIAAKMICSYAEMLKEMKVQKA